MSAKFAIMCIMANLNRRDFFKAAGAVAAAVPAYIGTRYQEHNSNVQAIKKNSDPNFDPSKADPEIKERLSQNLTARAVIGAGFAGAIGAQTADTISGLNNATSKSPKLTRRDALERLSRAATAGGIVGPVAGYLANNDTQYYLQNYINREGEHPKPKDVLDAAFWRDADFAKNSAIAALGMGSWQYTRDNTRNKKLAEDAKNSYDGTINDARDSLTRTGEVQMNPWKCFPDHRPELKELLPHELRNRFEPLRLTLTTWDSDDATKRVTYPRISGNTQQLAYFSGYLNDDRQTWSGPGVYPVDDNGKRIVTEKEVLVPLREFRLVINN